MSLKLAEMMLLMRDVVFDKELEGNRLIRTDAAHGGHTLLGNEDNHRPQNVVVCLPPIEQSGPTPFGVAMCIDPALLIDGPAYSPSSEARTNRWWLFAAESSMWPRTCLRVHPPSRHGESARCTGTVSSAACRASHPALKLSAIDGDKLSPSSRSRPTR